MGKAVGVEVRFRVNGVLGPDGGVICEFKYVDSYIAYFFFESLWEYFTLLPLIRPSWACSKSF